jgi:septal ring factor EnvC (AmiA/AmiB activator)
MENMERIGSLQRVNDPNMERIGFLQRVNDQNMERIAFLQRVNDSVVEEVKKYQINEAPLNKTVLELEQTNQDLHRKWWAVQDKIYVLEREIFDVGQENKRLADENKRLAEQNKEFHLQMWSTKSTAARMPNPYTCVLPDNRLNVLKHAPRASPEPGSEPHS